MKKFKKNNLNKIKIAIIGIGYVGLPLAIEFGKIFNVIGFDLNKSRISNLIKYNDKNKEILKKDFLQSKFLKFTKKIQDLIDCNVFIITVPTPILKTKKPNLSYIKVACKQVGKILKINDIVIFESTVYPGLTEEFCVPILEKFSKLKFNKDFSCGYSPERINPSDKKHTLKNVIKITSGSNQKASKFIDNLYKKIIKAGTFRTSSIKVAEAAKVIENSQRDINIAFVNELAFVFDKMKLNTDEILKAASTKWNFLNFKPGLVGGHCIGVDPYYLTFQSNKFGYKPNIILSGRKINNLMPNFIVKKTIKSLKEIFKKKKYNFLIMGLAFKENCSDIRNSKAIEIIGILKKLKHSVDAFDPIINKNEIYINNFNFINKPKKRKYDCIIITISHKNFKKMGITKIKSFLNSKGIIFDIKNTFKRNLTDLSI